MNYSVSYMLQGLGFKGSDAIVVLAERGFVTELRCVMPTCYCPGGRGFFERVGTKIPNDVWTPTQDHYPLTNEQGGHLVPENVRLAHKRCNGFDWGESDSHDEKRARASQQHADELSVFGGEALWSQARREQYPDNAPDFELDPSGRRGLPRPT
jgi:hypothetical protein